MCGVPPRSNISYTPWDGTSEEQGGAAPLHPTGRVITLPSWL